MKEKVVIGIVFGFLILLGIGLVVSNFYVINDGELMFSPSNCFGVENELQQYNLMLLEIDANFSECLISAINTKNCLKVKEDYDFYASMVSKLSEGYESCLSSSKFKGKITPKKCVDTDGGSSIFIQGICSDSNKKEAMVKQGKDYCLGDGVKEFSCVPDSYCVANYFPCPLGYFCESGACVKLENNSCVDSDAGLDYFSSGFVLENNETFYDSCSNHGLLTEYFCSGDQVQETLYNCTYGCESGACIENHGGCFCNSFDDCEEKLNNDLNCNFVQLISGFGGDSFSSLKIRRENVTFDCRGENLRRVSIYFYSDNITVTGCGIEEGTFNIFPGVSYSKIINNSFFGMADGNGVVAVLAGEGSEVRGNNVSFYPLITPGYELGIGIIFTSSGNGTIIKENRVFNNTLGIFLHNTGNAVVTDNIVINNTFGIWVQNKNNNIIMSNIISDNSYSGLQVEQSSNNTIKYNSIYNNTFYNLNQFGSSFGNNMTLNYWGAVDCESIVGKLSPQDLIFQPFINDDWPQGRETFCSS